MPRIVFLSVSGQVLATIAAEPGATLIDLARAHDIPLHWRCGQGTCGTCRVKIRHVHQPRVADISRKERNVLIRHGLLSDAAVVETAIDDVPDQWRLACHLVLDERDWEVMVPPPAD
ncbi:MAG: (2Fe-2S)-binding protein [Paludibacterium sp.]|uniref:2Fe-2S iron-sulfur cluster-binding protein n=1 Tax=Paludibacterium sp. TaxID=1917523 RepID=UPI002600C0B6|nr:2Fe-2S iron-sulfur cluster-binding protein [Paludibacterium sp.]MBV8048941.1 (2Fe-2S)-binding protein [Paludibacterium sp.]MBV8646762.1 (2Fe-2S)-binding protein [Paludibacterium sp.]